jgi:hypothetical protein
MSSIKDLRKAIAEREEKVRERNKQWAEEELVEEGLERAYRARRSKDQKKREKLFKEIVAWVAKFRNTIEYRKLIDQVSRGEKEGSIGLFRSGYGHCKDPDNNGCWSEILLHKGKLEYRAGYKWMGVNATVGHDRLVDLELKYLRKLVEHLESGKVYDTIIATTKPY